MVHWADIHHLPLFISFITFSGSSRSSPVLAIGMTPPQAPQQQQQTHQQRGFNLGGYVQCIEPLKGKNVKWLLFRCTLLWVAVIGLISQTFKNVCAHSSVQILTWSVSCCCFCSSSSSSVSGPMSSFGLTRSQSTSGVSQVHVCSILKSWGFQINVAIFMVFSENVDASQPIS